MTTEYPEWQWPLSGVHSILIVKWAQPSEGGGCTPFHTIIAITSNVFGLRSSWEGRYTPSPILLYPYMYSVGVTGESVSTKTPIGWELRYIYTVYGEIHPRPVEYWKVNSDSLTKLRSFTAFFGYNVLTCSYFVFFINILFMTGKDCLWSNWDNPTCALYSLISNFSNANMPKQDLQIFPKETKKIRAARQKHTSYITKRNTDRNVANLLRMWMKRGSIGGGGGAQSTVSTWVRFSVRQMASTESILYTVDTEKRKCTFWKFDTVLCKTKSYFPSDVNSICFR